MPDSPVFPGDFSVQKNPDVSQPSPSLAVSRAGAWWPHAHSPGSLSPAPASQQAGEGPAGHTHTRLSNVQDLAEDQGELDAASSEGALVFVFPAAVLEDKLEERVIAWC